MKTTNKYNKSAVSPQMQDWELVNWKKIYAYVKKLWIEKNSYISQNIYYIPY